MKLKIAAIAAAVLLSQSALALPQACPTIAAVIETGISVVAKDQDGNTGWWGGIANATLGTTDNWTFAAGPVQSQSQDQADVKAKITEKLSILGDPIGPIENQDDGAVCLYTNQDHSFVAIAITPPIALDQASFTKLTRQAKRR